MKSYNRLKGSEIIPVRFGTPLLESAPTYPHTYFTAHPGKPEVLIPGNSRAALPYITEQLQAGMVAGLDVPATSVAAFIYEHLKDFPTVKLAEEWKSYGVVIGAEGEDVGPASLLRMKKGPDVATGLTTSGATPRWQDIFFKIAMTFRMKKARDSPDPAYINNLSNKLTALGKTCEWKVNITGSVDTSRFDSLLEDHQVKCLLAAVDMFLHKFDNHPYSFLRAGTLVSRHRQCMALLDLYYVDMAFGLPNGDILCWIFVDSVADEVVSIYSQPDELAHTDSYLPYCVDMGLVAKSPYSATANPSIHNWAHTLGSLSGMERSKKAAVVGNPPPNLILAAATAAYGLGRSSVIRQTFETSDAERVAELDGVDEQDDATNLASTSRPLDKSHRGWVTWVQSDEAREIVVKHFSCQVKHFRRERPKSMEAFLAGYTLA
jgi:hypothetical protein